MEDERVAPSFTDRDYLLGDQYRDSRNLAVRVALHERFSAAPQPFFRWLFDLLQLPSAARILELGCGSARMWLDNSDRIPENWEIVLSDLSPGMLADARSDLSRSGRTFGFEVVDAQQIAFGDATFDAVIANFMLYHVSDRDAAFSEIRRVLRADGRLYAATLGRRHMRQLFAVLRQLDPGGRWGQPLEFTLDSGRMQLERHFSDVRLFRHEDFLNVTDVEALVAYGRSSARGGVLTDAAIAALRSWAESELQNNGAVRIDKDSGVFVARKRA